ncbi:MAG TPA: DNA-processing protein DprA [Methylomirabilota bacterium]|nr:DNA-processing protein DprA [Methylomirabilota bacterium]
MELDASLDWLALSLTPGLGARLTGRLLETIGPPEEIFRASRASLESCGLPAAPMKALQAQQPRAAAEKELAQLKKIGGKLLHWDEPQYPKTLRSIYDPPPLLYVRGDAAMLSKHILAIVGSRRPTPYGNQVAERMARDLAERGLVIASGMARGIDASAHRGACAASRGGTVGVLGTGLDVEYPKENRKLYAQVEQRGAMITEFPLGTPPSPENFPVRNRIIAGLALGVVVVQGEQHSGSVITARLAMEFGREVYGVPGNVTEPGSFAPHQLLRQGAKLAGSWEDVVEELPTPVRAELFPVEAAPSEERARMIEEALDETERKIYALLPADVAVQIDELVEKSGLNSSEVLAALCGMEMRGVVRQLPGKQFIKALV